MGSAVGKVSSLLLHACLSGWSEGGGHRAACQAGSWDSYRSSDHVFVLKHLIYRWRAPGGCFSLAVHLLH